ncbi:sugar ABC transporter substrate-binding protein [Robertmurraya yapensis]|uniref:Sugar ABC transporter substrate-binding protein n=1 Tax=Bacillus yapensis TaxID=2492960 RepID=A0A3S0IQG7_9BACI|nr:sugar ABC transporter substrate-binding protein [Bacillus yapensis]RTR29179.1 sugar ABC transporter substrate-binding protein [Bacillus yapensis]TKS94784.1 extracellular solute-binding protein [Bacillus yapensis]
MKIWKLFSILSIALILLFQAGCSDSSSSSSGEKDGVVTLKFWDMHTDAEKAFFEDLVKEYNAANEGKVKIEYTAFNQSDYSNTKLPVAFANDEGPDVFMVSPGDFTKYAESNILADLNSYFPEGAKEDFLPASIEAVTYDDKVLALPYELELLGLYYNKKMLADAGVEVPKTWDELKSAAEKLTTSDVAGLVLPTDKAAYLNFIWYPFLWQQGGNVLNEDGTKSTFNSPEVAKALDYWGSFFQDGQAPSKLQYGPWDAGNLGTGSAAMSIVGTWLVPVLEKDYADTEFGLAPIPVPEGGKPATDAGGWKMAVNANSEHVDEAAKFIMWCFAEDKSRPLKWATEVKFAYSPRISVVEEGQAIYDKGLRKVFTEEIYDSAIPEPRFGPEIVDAVGEAMQQVMFGDVSGEDAAEEAHKKIEEALNK